MVDRNFFFPRTAVGIVAVGDSGEALLLRAMLESLGASVRLYLPGTPEDILACLKLPDQPPPYLIISGHGDENGLVVGEFDTEVTRIGLKDGSMCADILSGDIDLRDTVVFSTACCTGSEAFAKAFMEGGARAYIASPGYPGDAAFRSSVLLRTPHPQIIAGGCTAARKYARYRWPAGIHAFYCIIAKRLTDDRRNKKAPSPALSFSQIWS